VIPDLLQRVRRTPDRWLHALRRRKAADALRARPRPGTVLVLCYGNICRSPIAAALLRRELEPLGIAVRSAGMVGFNRPSPPEAVSAATRYDVDLAAHRSTLMTADLVRRAELIVVMEAGQARQVCERFGRPPSDVFLLGDFDPVPVETRTIRDPLDASRAVYEETYARIARCVRALAQALPPRPEVVAHRP
jgi:protein-tyrosine phosphatase